MAKTMQAAVLWEAHTDWSVEEVTLDDPKEGEVLVRYAATGLCHSDDHARSGDMPMIALPVVGGHEGAGVVEEVGPGVKGFAPGDHVVASFIPACGRCRWCSTGHQNLCDLGAGMMEGLMPDGTSRLKARGRALGCLSMVGTFAPWNVVSQNSLVKIDNDIPLDKACLVGCGVTTGWGSAVNTAGVQPGDTVVVIGCGGIGSSAIQGARMAGAENIVAVDIAAGKKEKIQELGATHFVTSIDEAKALVSDLTRGVQADSAIITAGVVDPSMVTDSIAMIRKAGTVVVTGITPPERTASEIPWLEVTLFQKKIKGSLFGEANPWADIPRLLSLYRSGELKLDEIVTEYKLTEINQGYQDMLDGKLVRGVIRHEH
jgi:NDMA-dependent alcohol dehydrogenase